MLAPLTDAAVASGTGRILLRPPAPGDLAALAEIRRDRDMQAMLLAVIEATDDDAVHAWIARRAGDANGVFRVVADAGSDAALGYVQITDIHHRNRTGYAGIALRRAAQGKGDGKTALRLLHALAEAELGLEKLLLTVRTDNTPAVRLYRGAGYRVVGTLERHFRDHEGALHDVLLLERPLAGGTP